MISFFKGSKTLYPLHPPPPNCQAHIFRIWEFQATPVQFIEIMTFQNTLNTSNIFIRPTNSLGIVSKRTGPCNEQFCQQTAVLLRSYIGQETNEEKKKETFTRTQRSNMLNKWLVRNLHLNLHSREQPQPICGWRFGFWERTKAGSQQARMRGRPQISREQPQILRRNCALAPFTTSNWQIHLLGCSHTPCSRKIGYSLYLSSLYWTDEMSETSSSVTVCTCMFA